MQHVVGNIAATADTDEALDALMPWYMSKGKVETPDTLICWRLERQVKLAKNNGCKLSILDYVDH